MVNALEFRSEGRWFKAQSLPSCSFFRQDTLLHIVSLSHSGVQMGTGDILLALILYHVPLLTSVDLMLSGYGDSQM